MTLARRYLAGVSGVAALGAVAMAALPSADRAPAGWGAAVGLVLQAPLGWWAVRSIGTDRFMAIWGLGMLARFATVFLVGFLAFPILGRQAGTVLGAMVAVLVALLLVEGATALKEHSREHER